jgi:hypothetical protein
LQLNIFHAKKMYSNGFPITADNGWSARGVPSLLPQMLGFPLLPDYNGADVATNPYPMAYRETYQSVDTEWNSDWGTVPAGGGSQ